MAFFIEALGVTLLLSVPFTFAVPKYQILMHGGMPYAYEDVVLRGSAVSQKDVADWCRGLGGTLPSVHSKADVNFLHKLVTKNTDRGFVFLGGKLVSGKWLWQDGTPMDFKVTAPPDACMKQGLSGQSCPLALVARPGNKLDKTFATPAPSYALTGVKLCRLPKDSPAVAAAATTPAPKKASWWRGRRRR